MEIIIGGFIGFLLGLIVGLVYMEAVYQKEIKQIIEDFKNYENE